MLSRHGAIRGLGGAGGELGRNGSPRALLYLQPRWGLARGNEGSIAGSASMPLGRKPARPAAFRFHGDPAPLGHRRERLDPFRRQESQPLHGPPRPRTTNRHPRKSTVILFGPRRPMWRTTHPFRLDLRHMSETRLKTSQMVGHSESVLVSFHCAISG